MTSLMASVAAGATVTCVMLARAVAAAGRERTAGRLHAGRPGQRGRHGRLGGWRFLRFAWIHRLGAAVGGGAIGFWLAGPVGWIAGVTGAEVCRRMMRSRRRERARDLLDEQLREAMTTLSAAVRAGLSIRRALEEAYRGSDPPLRDSLASLVDQLRVGHSIDAALDLFARHVGSPDALLLTTLLAVHHRTGGDLPALLDEVASVVGQRAESRRQVRALTSQGRASGAVLAVLPIAFVGLLTGTSGDGLGAFYRSPPGAGLLLAGLVCELLGFGWIRRIVRTQAAP
jgi:tight adherence protein B